MTAALAYGPDVWEVIKFLREVDERGPAALDAAAEVFAVDASRISTSVSYYADYRDETDIEISDADEASARAEEAWRAGSRAMSDKELFAWTMPQGRWLLTENVKDFRPVMLRALPLTDPPQESSTPPAVPSPAPGRTPGP